MAGNERFHDKRHKKNHHSLSSVGYPDSGTDPIASPSEPFQGSFVINGPLSTNSGIYFLSASVDGDFKAENLFVNDNLQTNSISSYGTEAVFSDNALTGHGDHTITFNFLSGIYFDKQIRALDDVYVDGDVVITGNISALGDLSYFNTNFLTNSALSVVNAGFQPALHIDQIGNFPIAHFESNHTLIVEISSQGISVNGIINSTGNVSAPNITSLQNNSADWNNSYTIVNSNSSFWLSGSTIVRNYSGDWNSVYSSVNSNSSNWNNSYTTVFNMSSLWLSGATTVMTSSADWNNVYTSVRPNSSAWLSAATVVRGASADWNNTYTTLRPNSAAWLSAATVVRGTSANWNNSYTTTFNMSSLWLSGATTVMSSSANWNNSYTTTFNMSSLWLSGSTTVMTYSGNWNNVFTTVNANSGTWGTGGGASQALYTTVSSVSTTVASNSAIWTDPAGGSAASPTSRIRVRNDIGSNWTSTNPILSVGEIGYDKSAGKIKIGNGLSAWSTIPYLALSTGDLYWSYVKALLLGQGTNGDTTFTDSGPLGLTVTRGGSTIISGNISKWGGTSIQCVKNTSDYLTISDASFAAGTGDYCIECWVYLRSWTAGDGILLDTRTADVQGNPSLWIRSTGTFGLYVNGGLQITSAGTISLSSWHHLAAARFSGTTKLYADGSQVGSSYVDSNNWSSTTMRLFNLYSSTGNGLDAYVNDFRLTIGSARGYTGATITQPSQQLPTSS